MSMKFTPRAATRTRASPAFGVGRSTSAERQDFRAAEGGDSNRFHAPPRLVECSVELRRRAAIDGRAAVRSGNPGAAGGVGAPRRIASGEDSSMIGDRRLANRCSSAAAAACSSRSWRRSRGGGSAGAPDALAASEARFQAGGASRPLRRRALAKRTHGRRARRARRARAGAHDRADERSAPRRSRRAPTSSSTCRAGPETRGAGEQERHGDGRASCCGRRRAASTATRRLAAALERAPNDVGAWLDADAFGGDGSRARRRSNPRRVSSLSAPATACPLPSEIALKIKEASYRHAEGFGAGEFRHGSTAILDASRGMIGHRRRVVAFAPSARLLDVARDARAITVALATRCRMYRRSGRPRPASSRRCLDRRRSSCWRSHLRAARASTATRRAACKNSLERSYVQ